MWKHGLVGDVTIKVEKFEGNQVFLNVVLAERPRLTAYYFTGLSKGKESTLKNDLKLIRGKIVNDAMIRNTELAVKKHFVKKKRFPEYRSENHAGKRYRKPRWNQT